MAVALLRHHFRLRPFTSGQLPERLTLTASLVRRPGILQIEYRVEGELDCIDWSAPLPGSTRCQELWRRTCFEFFISIKDASEYWEGNVCPNGCWNIYRFTGYRIGMQEEGTIGQPVCRLVMDRSCLTLSCAADITGIIDDTTDIELGVSAVLKEKDGKTSYWALVHSGEEPDFHDRRSFVAGLPGIKIQ
jgi:hypothetical protein